MLSEMTTENLVKFAEEAFAAGDEAQVELIIEALRGRDEAVEADDIENILDRRRGQFRFTARCRAFSGESVQQNRILVERDGSVLVWDGVAGAYTRCHVLGASQKARLRKLARQF
jgi:hypothetical protein